MTESNDYSYLLDILKLAESSEKKEGEEELNLKFEGRFFKNDNCSKVNENLANIFLKDSSYNTSLIVKDVSEINNSKHKLIKDNLGKELPKTDIYLSHYFEPNFIIPKEGHWILMQNWDYGSIPKNWKESVSDFVDQLWVSSEYIKQSYIHAGIDSEKIRVIPSGIDSLTFNPHVNPYKLSTEKKVKFLFKGNLEWEKGFDVLLKAFSDEFVKNEDVCLVIATNLDINEENNKLIKEIKQNPDSPEILIINYPNNDENLIAELYKACTYFVLPYRAESYCLDLLESMACGVPPIVTNLGSAMDYCNEENSILIPASITHELDKNVQNLETVFYPYWANIDILDLRLKLREAFEMDFEMYKTLSKNTSKSIISKYTWVKINDLIKSELENIKNTPIKRTEQHTLNLKVLEALKNIQVSKFDEAFKYLEEAYNINKFEPRVNFYMANLLLHKQDHEKALKHLTISLKKDNDNEDINNLIGILLFKLGHYELSKRFFEKTLSLLPEHEGAKQSLDVIKNLDSITSKQQVELDKSTLEDLEKEIIKFEQEKLPTLSVCILTKNEQNHIERAIKSVKKVADEIIVLDTGSTDKTVELAKKLGANVYHTNWENSFAKARNEVLKYAKKDWILMLDADESFSENSAQILKLSLLREPKTIAHLIKIINVFDITTKKSTLEHYAGRLFRNNLNIKYIRDIHEIPVEEDGTQIIAKSLKGIEIIHYGYSKEIVAEKDKHQRNKILLEKMYNENPENPFNIYYLAVSYDDDFEKASNLLSKCIEVVKTKNLTEYITIMHMAMIDLIHFVLMLNKTDEALEKCKEFYEELSYRGDYWFLYSNIENLLGNYEKSIEYSKKALSLRGQEVRPSIDVSTTTWKPMFLIAKSYLSLNDLKNAEIYYKKAIKENPYGLDLYYQLAELYIKESNFDSLDNLYKKVLKLTPPNEVQKVLKIFSNLYLKNNLEDSLYKIVEKFRILIQSKSIPSEDLKNINLEFINTYNEIYLKKSDFLPVIYSLACCHNNIGEYEKAKNLFEKILETDELEVDTLHNLASIALNQKEIEKAEKLYLKVLEIDEFYSEAYASLAKLELHKGNIEKAKEYIKEIEIIDPDNKVLSEFEFELARKNNDKTQASDIYASMLFKQSL